MVGRGLQVFSRAKLSHLRFARGRNNKHEKGRADATISYHTREAH